MEVDGKIHHIDTASSTQVVGSNNLQHPWCHKLLDPTTCIPKQVVGFNIDVFILYDGPQMTMVRLAWKKQFFVIFGQTDLGISLSGAKFHEEADFDVRSGVAPPKSTKIDEKLISDPPPSNFFPNRFFDVLGIAKRRRRLEF